MLFPVTRRISVSHIICCGEILIIMYLTSCSYVRSVNLVTSSWELEVASPLTLGWGVYKHCSWESRWQIRLLLSSYCPPTVLHVHETPFYWWLTWGVGGFCSTLLRWGSKGPLATLRKGDSDLPRFIYSSYTDSLRTHDHPRLGGFVFAVGPRGTTKTLNHELWTAGG